MWFRDKFGPMGDDHGKMGGVAETIGAGSDQANSRTL